MVSMLNNTILVNYLCDKVMPY